MGRSRELAELATVFDAGGSLGFRNRIINGDMRIDQRNNGASVTPAFGDYTVDRWALVLSHGSQLSAQRSTVAPSGFQNSLLLSSLVSRTLGAGDFFYVAQYVEGFNAADLGWGAAGAQSVTLSFRVRSSLTGTFVVAVRSGSDDAAYPATYTINAANTWETKTITIPGPTSGTFSTGNGRGFGVWFSLGAGSSFNATANTWGGGSALSVSGATNLVATNGATLHITGVQLEAGSVATPFERRDYGRELVMCQRYYEKSYDANVSPGSSTPAGRVDMPANTSGATAYYVSTTVHFKATKRTQGSIRFWDQAGNLSRVTDYSAGGLVRTDNRNSVWGVASGDTSFYLINTQNPASFSSFQWDASAEL